MNDLHHALADQSQTRSFDTDTIARIMRDGRRLRRRRRAVRIGVAAGLLLTAGGTAVAVVAPAPSLVNPAVRPPIAPSPTGPVPLVENQSQDDHLALSVALVPEGWTSRRAEGKKVVISSGEAGSGSLVVSLIMTDDDASPVPRLVRLKPASPVYTYRLKGRISVLIQVPPVLTWGEPQVKAFAAGLALRE
ncbi:hypothetical protein [Kineosporia succinea]|uniref:Uncharacterized protein n=1 Tax=Kineosporia succinea TaxID=84632 RepID=A0ABT9PDX6_9ACTN|nr:hypothetical protein [Kineosporia succinea]MDP9830903.1 hypothetical protein [Kineosporia succinea]